jgi:GMP synthase-like glutamine amidotransferase
MGHKSDLLPPRYHLPSPFDYSHKPLTSQETYLTFPHIKIFGSCFGHQILCHALFSTHLSPVVCAHPAGWEVGVHAVTLSPAFVAHFGPVTTNPDSPNQVRLQMVHADHVVLPFSVSGHPDADSDSDSLALPEGWISIGSSAHCALQGVYQRGRVLTFQGHAEFDAWVTRETIDAFLRGVWSTEALEEAFVAIGKDGGRDDSLWAAEVMVRFFAEPIVREAVGKGQYSRL